jgi:hypothetical protein
VPADRTTLIVSASNLKRQRGWTEGLVETLLGAPDALAPNPHGFRPPMRFFAHDRVLEAERAPEFVRWIEKLDDGRAWRRTQPTRTHVPAELEGLEWLQDPRRIALFAVPRVPRRRLRRPVTPDRDVVKEPVRYPLPRFEVLRLF